MSLDRHADLDPRLRVPPPEDPPPSPLLTAHPQPRALNPGLREAGLCPWRASGDRAPLPRRPQGEPVCARVSSRPCRSAAPAPKDPEAPGVAATLGGCLEKPWGSCLLGGLSRAPQA